MSTESDFPHFINANGQKIFCKYWEPSSEIRAIALIVHGFGEHIGRYEKIANLLTGLGIRAGGHDQIGHGKSDGIRADVEEFDFFVRDGLQHVDLMKKKNPNVPIFLVSHSMGGLIASKMANKRPKEFMVLLMSPLILFNPRDASTLSIFAAKLAAFCMYNKRVHKLDPKSISRDPAVVKDYEEDPLNNHENLKIGFVVKMYDASQDFVKTIPSVDWTFFLLHGDKDVLTYIGGARQLYNDSKSKDKTLKIYEGYFHELDKEPEEDAKVVLNDIKEWISSRLEAATKATAAETEENK